MMGRRGEADEDVEDVLRLCQGAKRFLVLLGVGDKGMDGGEGHGAKLAWCVAL